MMKVTIAEVCTPIMHLAGNGQLSLLWYFHMNRESSNSSRQQRLIELNHFIQVDERTLVLLPARLNSSLCLNSQCIG